MLIPVLVALAVVSLLASFGLKLLMQRTGVIDVFEVSPTQTGSRSGGAL